MCTSFILTIHKCTYPDAESTKILRGSIKSSVGYYSINSLFFLFHSFYILELNETPERLTIAQDSLGVRNGSCCLRIGRITCTMI